MSDLALHYKVLKQFLDISDDTPRSKTSSTRATRAREKLLKLSLAQFKELSTDVYDELRRRIDESRGEPDYLLPKSSFHPKRNQARQKLSSLPQSRFKDLVSDISYEIERRNLHNEEMAQPLERDQSQRSLDHSKVLGAEDSQKSMVSDVPNQSIGLQSKTVVPTKANMDWSSDEDEDLNVGEAEQARAVRAEIPNGTSKKAGNTDDLEKQVAELEADKRQLEEKYRLLNEDYEYSTRQSKQLSNEVEELSEEKTKWLEEKKELTRSLEDSQSKIKEHQSTRDLSRPSPEMAKELESLKTANAALRLENQSLKRMSTRSDVSSPTKNRDISFGSHGHTFGMKKDIEMILEKLEQPVKVPKASSLSTLKSESEYWQKKYEAVRSDQISSLLSKAMATPELKQFYSASGLISEATVSKFYTQLESLITAVDKESFEPDLYFDMVSQMAITANKIATEGDDRLLNSNEQSIFVRESISYCLTTARYHAVYSTLLPKVVMERALGELSFAVCDLVAVCKINTGNVPSKRPAEIRSNQEDFSAAVRPLRMTSKLKDLPKEEIPARTSSLNDTRGLLNARSGLSRAQGSPLSPQSKPLSNQSTPTKANNVFERAKIFDSPEDKPLSSNSREINKGQLNIDDLNKEDDAATNVGSGKGKGLFQSLRDRLNAETPPEPSKEPVLKEQPVAKDKGMFLAIRDRFAYADEKETGSKQDTKEDDMEDRSRQAAVTKVTVPLEDSAPEAPTHNDLRVADSAESTMIEQPTQASLMNMHKRAVNMVPVETRREDKPKKVNYANTVETIEHPASESEDEYEDDSEESEDEGSKQARERQEYRKSMAAATFNVDLFDIDDPDNTLTQVLLYLEHQTVQVISTIQSLLSAIKKPNATRGDLRDKSQAITEVISQMTEATNTSMNQTRNAQLKEHGKWVVTSLEDCRHRMDILCRANSEKDDTSFADKNFKQRLAGISFDIAKCTKELVKSVEEASLKEEIANLDARISQGELGA